MENLYYHIEKRLDDNIKRLTILKDIIKTIDNKYTNKLIHVTDNGELNLNETFNEYDNDHDNDHEPEIKNIDKDELKGLWLSCGSNWIKWVMLKSDNYCFNDTFLTSEYIYEIETKGKKILYINTLDELITFHNEYAYNIENIGYNIYWDIVKKKYDGMVIESTLAYKIWERLNDIKYNENDNKLSEKNGERDENDLYSNNSYKGGLSDDSSTMFFINPLSKVKKADNLKDCMLKYAKFYLNWYLKWGTFTGILWDKRTIKKIKLLKFKINNK